MQIIVIIAVIIIIVVTGVIIVIVTITSPTAAVIVTIHTQPHRSINHQDPYTIKVIIIFMFNKWTPVAATRVASTIRTVI